MPETLDEILMDLWKQVYTAAIRFGRECHTAHAQADQSVIDFKKSFTIIVNEETPGRPYYGG